MNTDRILIQAYVALRMGDTNAALARLLAAERLCNQPMRWLWIRRAIRLLKR